MTEQWILENYWWLGMIYFVIGFVGFYVHCWVDKKRGGFGSPNGFWGDLFVATMWGIMWAALLFAVLITWPVRKLYEKTGIFINLFNLIGAAGFGYATIWCIKEFIGQPSWGNAIWALIMGLFCWILLKGWKTKPTLSEWAKRGIDKDLQKMKEDQGLEKEQPGK